MDSDFLQARIDATKTQIVAYEDAASALASGGVQEYLLDTGQTRQRVTKMDLSSLQKAINSLYNRLATLEARQSGGSTRGTPGW